MITREQLEESRRREYKVYGYKKAFCDLNDCCEHCDGIIRCLCVVIRRIENIQSKRILKICKPSVAAQAGEGERDG